MSDQTYFALFSTAIGSCVIAWGASGIATLQLPERSDAQCRSLLCSRYPGAVESPPPHDIELAITAVRASLTGGSADLVAIVLDMSRVPNFHRQVYELTRQIPRGTTRSYGDLATQLGKPQAARAVGQALGRNPWAIIVPCHRVVAKSGRLTGFSAFGGIATKRRLLALEGVTSNDPGQ